MSPTPDWAGKYLTARPTPKLEDIVEKAVDAALRAQIKKVAGSVVTDTTKEIQEAAAQIAKAAVQKMTTQVYLEAAVEIGTRVKKRMQLEKIWEGDVIEIHIHINERPKA